MSTTIVIAFVWCGAVFSLLAPLFSKEERKKHKDSEPGLYFVSVKKVIEDD